jgi:hypothetical protein
VLKPDDWDAILIPSPVAPACRAKLAPGSLQSFVSSDELRRLLCRMAGTELLFELCQALTLSGSTREMKLPPTLL